MTQTEAILTMARAGNARAAEEALMTALENPSAPVEEWPAIVEQIAKAARGNAAETIAWATLDAILMRLPPIAAMPYCGRILQARPAVCRRHRRISTPEVFCSRGRGGLSELD